jgi:hypothetical protein
VAPVEAVAADVPLRYLPSHTAKALKAASDSGHRKVQMILTGREDQVEHLPATLDHLQQLQDPSMHIWNHQVRTIPIKIQFSIAHASILVVKAVQLSPSSIICMAHLQWEA